MSADRSVSERFPWFSPAQLSQPPLALVLTTLAIVASETAIFYGSVELALMGHLVTFLACLIVPFYFRNQLPLLQMLALLPLFRLINLGMPAFVDFTLLFLPVIYAPMIPAIYLVLRSQGIRLGTNPRALVLFFVPILALAALFGWLEYQIITPEALISDWSTEQLLLLVLVQVGFVSLVEEVLFRGVLQRGLAAYVGRWGGVLFASALFGVMHSIYGSGLEIIFAAVLGLVFGVIYEWTNSLGLVIVFHGVLNVLLFGVYPIHGVPLEIIPM